MYKTKDEKDLYVLDNLKRQRLALLKEEKPSKKLITALEEQMKLIDPKITFDDVKVADPKVADPKASDQKKSEKK